MIDFTGGLLLVIIIFLIIFLCFVVFYVVGLWKLFEKAGEEGWKAIVPFYNIWTLVSISELNWWYFILILFNVVVRFDYDGIISVKSLSFVSIVAYFFCYYNISKKIHQDTGFAILITLFPFVMIPVIGLSSKYQFDSSVVVSPNGPINDNKGNNSSDANDKDIIVDRGNIKYCSYCGNKIDINDKYCGECGKEVK